MQGCKILLFILGMIVLKSSAWTIGAKDRVLGPSIHITYFQTPNNLLKEVRAQLYVGRLVSGSCQYVSIYDLGREKIRSGDRILIDGIALREIIGIQYNCAAIFYFTRQSVIETFLLRYDGLNYINTYPSLSYVRLAAHSKLLTEFVNLSLMQV